MYHDVMLQSREYSRTEAPFAVVCSWTRCQTIIKPGTPVHKYDGATYTHSKCPTLPLKRFAVHKYASTGLGFK